MLLSHSLRLFSTISKYLNHFANGFEWAWVEKYFDYLYYDAIIAAHDPFHPDFDASLALWGPMMVENIYILD